MILVDCKSVPVRNLPLGERFELPQERLEHMSRESRRALRAARGRSDLSAGSFFLHSLVARGWLTRTWLVTDGAR